jgi:hypothetical protein
MVKGKIAVGLVGDWAVLSQDILKIPARELPATVSLLYRSEWKSHLRRGAIRRAMTLVSGREPGSRAFQC